MRRRRAAPRHRQRRRRRRAAAAAARLLGARHDAAYFLLHSLLRQRASVVLCAVPLLCASLRALLDAIGALRSGDVEGGAVDVTDGRRQDVGDDEQLGCARNVRRLFEEVAEKKRALLRHGAYFLADAVAALRRPNLGAAARTEVSASGGWTKLLVPVAAPAPRVARQRPRRRRGGAARLAALSRVQALRSCACRWLSPVARRRRRRGRSIGALQLCRNAPHARAPVHRGL